VGGLCVLLFKVPRVVKEKVTGKSGQGRDASLSIALQDRIEKMLKKTCILFSV